jgi:hypothetical protein
MLTKLILGDSNCGYFGEVNSIISGDDLFKLTDLTNKGDDEVNEDIVWLQFTHKNKILFIPNRNLKLNISWDDINRVNCSQGRIININGINYLCRLPRGSHTNPAPYENKQNEIIGIDNEWNNLIVKYDTNEDGFWSKVCSWCQDEHISGPFSRVVRGGMNIDHYGYNLSFRECACVGWRPVLELK